MLYSRTLWFIHLKCNSLHLLTPKKQWASNSVLLAEFLFISQVEWSLTDVQWNEAWLSLMVHERCSARVTFSSFKADVPIYTKDSFCSSTRDKILTGFTDIYILCFFFKFIFCWRIVVLFFIEVMLCYFLLYSKVTELYIYIYILFFILFHYGLSQDIEYSSCAVQ